MKLKPRTLESRMSQTTLSMLIDFYTGDMQRRGCTPDSVITNKRALQRFSRSLAPDGQELKLTNVTPERAKAYITALQTRECKWADHPRRPADASKLSPFTIRKEVKILRGFGTWLTKQGCANPFDVLEIPKVPKYVLDILSDQEIEKLLEAINPNIQQGARLYTVVVLMLDSGLRIGEVAEARLGDLDMERRQLKVMGKGRKERFIPFGQRCAQTLMKYIHLHRPQPMQTEYDNLFLSPDGMPMTRNSLESMIRRLRISSGITRLHAHLFRHTFAVKFLTNGGDLRTLQLILGHESLVVTQRYLHFTTQQVQTQYQSFSPMDKLPLNSLRPFGNRRKKLTPSAEVLHSPKE